MGDFSYSQIYILLFSDLQTLYHTFIKDLMTFGHVTNALIEELSDTIPSTSSTRECTVFLPHH